MKKIFQLQQANKNRERTLDAVKHEVRKYLRRERKKKLPEDAVFWGFDCRFGQNSEAADPLPVSEIIAALDKAHDAGWDQCYVEIIAKASYKTVTQEDKGE